MTKFRSGTVGFALSLAISVALSVSASQGFAKDGVHALSVVHSPSTPAAAPKRHWTRGDFCKMYPQNCGIPLGHTQPTCRGPHRGPNGVMVQCD
jgi:hypothetical protein